MSGNEGGSTMETRTASQGLLLPGDASPDPGMKSPPPAEGNTNGLAPDNTERPARKPGEGRKYFSFSQYTKYVMLCQEMYRCGILNRCQIWSELSKSVKGTTGWLTQTTRANSGDRCRRRSTVRTGLPAKIRLLPEIMVPQIRTSLRCVTK